MPTHVSKIFKFYYLFFFFLTSVVFATEVDVKVAVVHFQPHFQQISNNIERLLQLADEAGSNGAKIIVFPELATSGYSFFNRAQVRHVAEAIPGKTTELFSQIARRYASYIVIGLPEYDKVSNLFYNTAVLINPNGEVDGIYRKHSHLMESSWSSLGTGQVPIFETIYGNLAILICADINYSELSSQAISKEVKFLVLPTNGGIDIDLLRARALEGRCHLILSNRYGNEREEYLTLEAPESFNEETLTLFPPFFYDFQDGKSLIIDATGEIKLILKEPSDSIGYCDLPLQIPDKEKVIRRPELYALIGNNTLDPYSVKCMNLPHAGIILVAAADLKSKNLEELLVKIKDTLSNLSRRCFFFNNGLKLVVFPSNVLTGSSSEIETIVKHLGNFAVKYGVDFVIGFRKLDEDRSSSMTYLLTNDRKCFPYKRLHKLPSEKIEVGEHFTVVDRDYGRLAIIQGKDLWVPETSRVLGKMGVDLVAVSAEEEDDLMRLFCKVRSSDSLHILMSNQTGCKGIYGGSFKMFPQFKEDDETVLMELDIQLVREKKELKIGFDYQSILKNDQLAQ